jgi:NADH-quinone oxidoreductase subunit L
MALIQKDMKRLLSYHAISQVGYMVLGIGTALPIGIVGGLFHMLNNAVYKSCLYMTAGSIEKQTGTTDLRKIGGLSKRMPFTAICFTICALSIAGVPPFNGFFSKELIFDAALESNVIFYIGALLGAFMTAVSFLKMGRAAFAGKLELPTGKETAKESCFYQWVFWLYFVWCLDWLTHGRWIISSDPG